MSPVKIHGEDPPPPSEKKKLSGEEAADPHPLGDKELRTVKKNKDLRRKWRWPDQHHIESFQHGLDRTGRRTEKDDAMNN